MVAGAVTAPCDTPRAYPAPGRRAPSASPPHAAWIIATTVIGSSMAFIDSTVVNVALPAIQRQLHATGDATQWVMEAYALVLAGFILMGGALGDRVGRRRLFALGSVVFGVASLGCGFAASVAWLIAARAVQGLGAALLIPGSLAILGASFEGGARGRAVGTWSAFTAIATAGGPVLGGWLVQHVSWRWVFFINPPLAAAVIAMAYYHVPESRAEAHAPLDWAGAAAATVGLGGLVTAALELSRLGATHPLVLGALGIGCAALAAFVRIEMRSAAPMLPLALFHERAFAGVNLLTLLLYAALGGALFFVPFDLIQVQGYSATAAGAALLPVTALLFVLSQRAERLMERIGAETLLTIGPAIAAIGFALFARPSLGGSYWTTYFPAALVLGLGMGLTVAPLTTSVMNAVPPQHVGVAAGVNNAVARTAGVVGLALMVVVAAWVFGRALGGRLATLGLPPAVVQALTRQRTDLAGIPVPAGLDAARALQVRDAIAVSFVASFRAIMLFGAGLALASALVGWRAFRSRAD